jgi:hypothetical protein
MARAILCLFICFFFLNMEAQLTFGNEISSATKQLKPYQDTVWIVSGLKPIEYPFKKRKLDFVFDARQTLVSTKVTRLLGIRVGLEYRRVHRFGIGIYNIGEGVRLDSLKEINASIETAVLNLTYASIFYERVLFFNPKWEWSATIHQGQGFITGKYLVAGDSTWQNFPIRRVLPFEISTTGYFNITWWCSFGAGVGYRYMRSTPADVRPVYNAPVLIARVRIKLGKLVKSIWNQDVKYAY